MPSHRFVQELDSPLEGVHNDAWVCLVEVLEVQPVSAVSKSGGLGSYDTRPRRLIELGYAIGLRSLRINGRQVHACDFVPPWTKARFLADPMAQYAVLAKSMRLYYDALQRGDLVRPNDASVAGALAVLHIGGLGALADWPNLFDNTRALYKMARGAF